MIVKLEGREVESASKFRERVSSTPPGTEIALQLQRDGKLIDLKARTGTLPDDSGEPSAEKSDAQIEKIGVQVQDLTQPLAHRYGYRGIQGVLVSEVEQGSAADLAGIEPGNLIMSVNKRPVTSVAEFMSALQKAGKENGILFYVRSGKFSRYVVLRPD